MLPSHQTLFCFVSSNMNMKLLVIFCLAVVAVAEPPVGQEGPQHGGAPSSQYGHPSGQFENPSHPQSQYGAPQGQFGGGQRQQQQQQQSRPGGEGHNRPSSQYGVPSGYAGDDNNEPANYEYKYDVEDQQYGVKFGHEENRQGDVATGSYYVLLPDGRTQHVEYQADQDGYKPKITYEEGQGGYPRGGSSGYSR